MLFGIELLHNLPIFRLVNLGSGAVINHSTVILMQNVVAWLIPSWDNPIYLNE
jgi:hypothetical protein